ncbi:MAG TPA: LL-diaminopimelate aminotransferase [Spirochaetota bacterium]|nr:LL-diaminopimelate aminotransferase [Spirochaetota bacterium]HOD16400.1 LL-diaminopimelate aminotransferase [Spirochaetota bacterium]HPG50638.1 LL-diaminopimelate aminotransferase [Spirochaetota bacterium]HPN11095.1 LL-diaminopimelate aminotransferase [Spirochaetota bacterium]HQL81952.1 LL-diaminopimelate aminotransferase [Spirochaetota bacterium]
MIRVNENYLKLKASYLFSDIARRVAEFAKKNPDREIVRLGIGDVTRPLPAACIDAFHRAVDDMASEKTFRGYGPEQGYDFLREKIAAFDYRARGADIDADEIFVSDGAKCDTGNIQELFARDIAIAVPDPVYPVYVDTNVMAGRTSENRDGRYGGLVYLESTEKNSFVPGIPKERADLIYLCFPNNPTGATATKEDLAKWVAYARENKSLILYDAAYECFIRDDSIPRSIFEIEGADEVAMEFRSFSKTAGFTGTRCAFTVVPKKCRAYTSAGEAVNLHPLWLRRQTTKFNGVSYPVQRAAEAVYSDEGRKQVREIVDFYLGNASVIRNRMSAIGFSCYGGVNAPYIWVKGDRDSWEFFDLLLEKAGVVCTPGAGFGRCGEGFIRISAFNSRENVVKALDRIESALK